MQKFIRTNSENSNFRHLVGLLDTELADRDGDDHTFYAQYNKINMIRHAIVFYENEKPIGCGAFKPFDKNSVEVKRMYVLPEMRGKGIASQILLELENWAAEIGYERSVLETGKRQPEAIALYTKRGYAIIPNFGQYQGIENSVCFEKKLPQFHSTKS